MKTKLFFAFTLVNFCINISAWDEELEKLMPHPRLTDAQKEKRKTLRPALSVAIPNNAIGYRATSTENSFDRLMLEQALGREALLEAQQLAQIHHEQQVWDEMYATNFQEDTDDDTIVPDQFEDDTFSPDEQKEDVRLAIARAEERTREQKEKHALKKELEEIAQKSVVTLTLDKRKRRAEQDKQRRIAEAKIAITKNRKRVMEIT